MLKDQVEKLLPPPRVLLVEDDKAEADLIRRQLLERNNDAFEIHIVNSVAQIQQWVTDNRPPPDVILLDLNLPDSRGPQTVKRCQQLLDVPIVVLTGLDDVLAQQIAIETGADDYLMKGGEPTALRRAIYHAMLRHRRDADLRLAATVFEYTREAIIITTADGTILDVNAAFCRITGYSRQEVLGQNPRLLKSGRHDKEFYVDMWQALLSHGYWSGEIWNQHRDGRAYAEALTISAVRDGTGAVRNYVALFSDITLQKQQHQQLEYFAHHDILTGLPNRVLLMDRLQQIMHQNQRRDFFFAVVYLDLDGFKAINDEHGHDAGDQVLRTVAKRMQRVLRSSDTLARLGGDEFVAILGELSDADACLPLLKRLLAAANENVISSRGDCLQVSASIGVTFYPQAEVVPVEQLLEQADQAMYQAKLAGKNSYYLYDTAEQSGYPGRCKDEQGESAAHSRQ